MADPARAIPDSLRILVAGSIDYAGLFPPAGLAMPPAVDNYASYLAGPDAWALGRFVVPIARLDEFAGAASRHAAERSEPWTLSALAGDDLEDDLGRVARHNEARAAGGGASVIDAVEFRAAGPGAIRRAGAVLPPDVAAYAELPLDDTLAESLAAAREAGVRVKVRTGGITVDAFPAPTAVATFIVECGRAGVPFKATAGLHHALRARYPLTYERGAPHGVMFGFVNVFLAAAFTRGGADRDTVRRVLEIASPTELHFTAGGVTWAGLTLSTPELARSRADGAIAFGSCSFTEPVADLALLVPS
jgi:hypothetical protein